MNLHTFISCLLPLVHLGLFVVFFFPLECIYKPLNYFQKQGENKRIKIPSILGKKKPKRNIPPPPKPKQATI